MKIDQEELNYIIQDIKDEISPNASITLSPYFNRIYPSPDKFQNFDQITISIPFKGIDFKFYNILPYIEQSSNRLLDMKIKMINISIKFTDEETTKINADEFYEIMNDGYSSRKPQEEFYKLISVSKNLKNLIRSIDQNNNISQIIIRYEYLDNLKKEPKSWIKKFKSYFEK